MNTELKFVIKRKNNTKSMFAHLVVKDDNQIRHSISIKNDVLKLFRFATDFSINNNINVQKVKRVHQNITTETIIFDKGNFIVNNFNKDLIINRSNKYKVNKKIALGTVIGLIGITSIGCFSLDNNKVTDNTKDISNDDNKIESNEGSINSDLKAGFSNIFDSDPDLSSLNITFDFDNDSNITNDAEFNHSSVGNIELLSFNYEDRSNSECVNNAKSNMDTFNKYGEKYGIDPNLLMAIMSHESSGIHVEYSQNGHAMGGFQIESIWDGQSLSAYNFETKEMETLYVEYDRLKDFDYNAKIASMILQLNMREFNYNVPQAVQAYNMGLTRVKDFGNDWNTARLSCDKGDPMYIEHVFSYLPDGYYLTIKKPDGNTTNFIIDNMNSDIYKASTTK